MSLIETERLFLKLYSAENKPEFINLVTDEAVMKHVDKGVLSAIEAEKLWQKLILELYPQKVETIWAVFAKADLRYIGHAAIRPRIEKPEDWEISYMLRQSEWSKGFATEIARRLVAFGFNQLNLPQIFATVDDDNFPSIRVLEKAGMQFERYEYDEKGRFSVYSVKKQFNR